MTLPDAITTGQLASYVIASMGAATLGLLGWAARRLRGTTLRGPLGWSAAAIVAVVGATLLTNSQIGVDYHSALRLLAAVTTLTPAIAVFGAKRPQDHAWFFIVLTLWIVLALPAAEAWLLRGGAGVALHGARSAFVAILLVAGWGNYLSRRPLAATILLAGQWLLLDEFLAWQWLPGSVEATQMAGCGCVLASAWLAWLGWLIRRRRSTGWNATWQRFGDAYGLIWSVRVAERFNQAMKNHNVEQRLNQTGLSSPKERIDRLADAAIRPAASRALRALLLRFVNTDWLP